MIPLLGNSVKICDGKICRHSSFVRVYECVCVFWVCVWGGGVHGNWQKKIFFPPSFFFFSFFLFWHPSFYCFACLSYCSQSPSSVVFLPIDFLVFVVLPLLDAGTYTSFILSRSSFLYSAFVSTMSVSLRRGEEERKEALLLGMTDRNWGCKNRRSGGGRWDGSILFLAYLCVLFCNPMWLGSDENATVFNVPWFWRMVSWFGNNMRMDGERRKEKRRIMKERVLNSVLSNLREETRWGKIKK